MKKALLGLFILTWYLIPFAKAQSQSSKKVPYSSSYRVDPDYPYYLINQQNNHLFILNRTAWAYFSCEYPENVIKKAKDQGVTSIRVALEGSPFKSVLNYDMWPWMGTREKPDFGVMNEKYWKEVERRIKLAGDQGIGINLTIYFTFKPQESEIEAQRLYWKTIINRLSNYSNIICWEIMNEYTQNEKFQDAAGAYFVKNDPFNRPVISSDGTTDDALWPDKPWMGMAIVHTCTGSTSAHDLQNWYNAIAKNVRAHGKPAWNNETGREIRHKNDDGVHRRKQSWISNTAGCFWTHHTWDGCEGINDTSYVSPGQEFLKPLSNFFQSIPFWTLNPNYTVCQVSPDSLISNTMSDTRRNFILSYVCTRRTGQIIEAANVGLRLPNGTYTIEFIDPSINRKISDVTVISAGLKSLYPIILPTFKDDLVLKIQKVKSEKKTIIPGTE